MRDSTPTGYLNLRISVGVGNYTLRALAPIPPSMFEMTGPGDALTDDFLVPYRFVNEDYRRLLGSISLWAS